MRNNQLTILFCIGYDQMDGVSINKQHKHISPYHSCDKFDPFATSSSNEDVSLYSMISRCMGLQNF